jgi:hypothetical protein
VGCPLFVRWSRECYHVNVSPFREIPQQPGKKTEVDPNTRVVKLTTYKSCKTYSSSPDESLTSVFEILLFACKTQYKYFSGTTATITLSFRLKNLKKLLTDPFNSLMLCAHHNRGKEHNGMRQTY